MTTPSRTRSRCSYNGVLGDFNFANNRSEHLWIRYNKLRKLKRA